MEKFILFSPCRCRHGIQPQTTIFDGFCFSLVKFTVIGSGGSRGGGVQAPPPLGHDVGFLTLGPKLDPPPFLLVDLRWTPVADPGCVCDRGGHPAPLGMWMTSRGQCPRGGGVLVNVQEWGRFSNFLRADDVTRTKSKGGGCL